MREQNTVFNFLITLVLFTLFSCSGCSRKGSLSFTRIDTSSYLFIEMPSSINAFESLEKDLYTALYKTYKSHGYTIVKNKTDADFILQTVIRWFDNSERLVSPDLIPYINHIQLTIECTLTDRTGIRRAQKSFNCSTWADRPHNVRLNSHFARAEYQKLCNRYVGRIEHFFRLFFCKKSKQ